MSNIKIADSDAELERCYPVMAELRKHLRLTGFLESAKRQRERFGFEIVFAEEGTDIKAVAGIRIAEWLAGGKYLEIEDLVTKEGERSSGHGGDLFDWIVEFAIREGCDHLRLVSSVTRFGAHRFYLKKGMDIEAHYFSMSLQ